MVEKNFWGEKKKTIELDETFKGSITYEGYVRPVIHGVYHDLRGSGYIGNTPNKADKERAKQQYDSIGKANNIKNYCKKK